MRQAQECVAEREEQIVPTYEVTEPRLRCVLPFEAVPTEVRLLRRAVSSQLCKWGVPTLNDEVELLVTELATNVIKHVGEGVSATLILERRSERLRVEVHDKSFRVPVLRSPECDEECGRGLHLLAGLAADWGAVLTAVGKTVWCEILLAPRSSCLRVERAVRAVEHYWGGGEQVAAIGRRREVGLEESAVELIADLLHWAVARGWDPDDFLDQAQDHYEAEAGVA